MTSSSSVSTNSSSVVTIDDCSAAQDVGPGQWNGDTTHRGDGNRGCGNDTDGYLGDGAEDQVWRLSLAEPAGVRITLNGFDAALYLLEGATCALATLIPHTCRDGLGDRETLELGILPPGTYWLVVNGYKVDSSTMTGGPYTLDVQVVAPFCVADPSERYGGNTLSEALAFGPQTVDAPLTLCPDDQDWFIFRTTGGDVQVPARVTDGSDHGFAPELQRVVRLEDGSVSSFVVEGLTYAQGILTAPGLPPGEYAMTMRARQVPPEGIAYALNLSYACPPDVLEMAHGLNNTSTTALGMVPMVDDYSLGLCPGDEDWYWVIHSGGDFTVKAEPPSGTLNIELQRMERADDGTPTTVPVTVDPNQPANRLAMTDLPSGEYAVRVSAPSVPANGLPYQFNLLYTCVPDDAEFKPGLNDTVGNAFGPIREQPFDVTLSICPGDQDWFNILHPGGDLLVKVMGSEITASLEQVVRTVEGSVSSIPLAGLTSVNGYVDAKQLVPGEYGVHIQGTVPPTGTDYQFNVFRSCEEDMFEITRVNDRSPIVLNNTPVHATGPIQLPIPATAPGEGALCPGDTDHLWFRNMGAQGAVTVTLLGGAMLHVDVLDAVMNGAGEIASVVGNTTAQTTTHVNDQRVTIPDCPAMADFVLAISATQGFTVPSGGLVYKVVYSMPPPGHDTCTGAKTLTLPETGAPPVVVHGSTWGAANDFTSSNPECDGSLNGPNPDVFYAFIPTQRSKVRVDLTSAQDAFDSILELLAGSCESPKQLACNDDAPGRFGSRLDAVVEAGEHYLLVVDSVANPGFFTLTITTTEP